MKLYAREWQKQQGCCRGNGNTARSADFAAARGCVRTFSFLFAVPARAELTHRFNTYEQGRALRYYRASGCAQCALKSKCARDKGNRTITREEDEPLMEELPRVWRRSPRK